jgi:hypothetical protein
MARLRVPVRTQVPLARSVPGAALLQVFPSTEMRTSPSVRCSTQPSAAAEKLKESKIRKDSSKRNIGVIHVQNLRLVAAKTLKKMQMQ